MRIDERISKPIDRVQQKLDVRKKPPRMTKARNRVKERVISWSNRAKERLAEER